MDELSSELARILAGKAERRRRLARMSFSEKVKAVVRLQQMAAPLLRKQGKRVRIWPLDV